MLPVTVPMWRNWKFKPKIDCHRILALYSHSHLTKRKCFHRMVCVHKSTEPLRWHFRYFFPENNIVITCSCCSNILSQHVLQRNTLLNELLIRVYEIFIHFYELFIRVYELFIRFYELLIRFYKIIIWGKVSKLMSCFLNTTFDLIDFTW